MVAALSQEKVHTPWLDERFMRSLSVIKKFTNSGRAQSTSVSERIMTYL